jgi:hypothetical protein
LTAEDKKSSTLLGFGGLVIGTIVTYQKSGASQSTPQTLTGAIRRVCAVTPSLCQQLLEALEEWARQERVDTLIALAYEEENDDVGGSGSSTCTDKDKTNRHPDCLQRPNRRLLRNLGYEESSDLQIKGVIQFEKKLTNPGTINPVAAVDLPPGNETIDGVREAVVAVVLVFGLIVTIQAVAQFMGLDVWSETNSRLGMPLSTQELERLRQEEGLQRTSLNDGEWQDLSPEEQQEELAIMKIIQGEDIRLK